MSYDRYPPQEHCPPPARRPRLSPGQRRARRRRRLKRKLLRLAVFVLLPLALVSALAFFFTREQAPEPAPVSAPAPVQAASLPAQPPEVAPAQPEYTVHTTADTATVSQDFPSQYVILMDMDTGEVIAQKDPDASINPASMTKILTLLVAAEQISDTSGTFTMTREVADYCFSNGCSVVGYEVGEEIPVIELFYGCILCSGADACLGLVEVAFGGDHDAFVDKMNEKLEELGLSQTAHFTNCVGLYDQDHFCTVTDMALILKAALDNDFCRQVLSTKIYQSQPTAYHDPGQVLSNWFTRRIEDQDTGAVSVSCSKTGYVEQSGYCAASFGQTEQGRRLLCVTGKSTSTWQSIYDHAELYRTYFPTPEA